TTYYALYNFDKQNTSYLEKSLRFFSQSVQLIEATMSEYFFESSKYNYSEKLKLVLIDALDVAYELNEKTKIYEFVEKSKGQVLATLINEVSAKQKSQIPGSILNKEASLKRELNYHRNELLKIKLHYSLKDSLIVKNLETNNINLHLKYDSLLNYIGATFPLYKKYKNNFLVQPYKKIQEQLHIGEAMIQYFIGNEKLYILLLSKEEIFVSENPINTDFLEKEIQKFLLTIKLSDYHLFVNTSQKLFDLLISPIYPYLKNKKKLIIIPDDYLYLVPFEALVEKTENSTIPLLNNLPYLIKQFEISYHFSSSIWSLNQMKPTNSTYTYDFVGFAPVSYRHTNSQNQKNSSISKSTNTDLVSFEKRDDYFKDLPNTEIEIREIKKLFELSGKYAQTYLFSKATEENFKLNVDKAKCIHVATHGFSDKINPELSGLVFSETSIDDKNNRSIKESYFNSDNDGILYLSETFNLETTADLVVLGACETGVGRIIKGEGVLALTRGFVYSGALNVVNTLWKIPDKLTKDFMVLFYTEMLKGHSYSKALQITKLNFIQHNSTTLPIFWSGFLLIGN
ncbi:MAG: CHAT domain-containing protein, partial [Bacteroidales bacterium]|nr:CHAT domain-containing protein [Bacteroidales bacterium]